MNKSGRRRALRTAALILAMLLVTALTSCFFSDFTKMLTESSAINGYDQQGSDSETTETERSSFFVDIKPGQTIESDGSTQSDTIPDDEGSLDDITDDLLLECISSYLDNFAVEIDLTSCLDGFRIEENRVDELISRVVKVFEYKYMQDPFVFYLDGAMQVGYELQSGWGSRYLTSMTLKLKKYDRYENLDVNELEQIKAAMISEAQAIVDLAGTDRAEWEKLLIAHDELVRRISYDTSLNQSNNQTASALLDDYSLCKGYAQSFKLICDLMSIECQVISGQADGIEHAWNLVKLDGGYYHIDVTHDDPVPDRGPSGPVDHRHFLRSDDMMSETHQWKRENYKTAAADGAHYFRQNELIVNDVDMLKDKLQKFLMISDFADNRDDQLELLFEGTEPISQDQFDEMFKTALSGSNLNRQRFSYQVSAGKNVLQLIIMAE